jgi:hypothetical protein
VAREIMCVSSCAGAPSEADLVEQTPYRWPGGLSGEQFAELTAEMVGGSLAGKPAEFAGDPAL